VNIPLRFFEPTCSLSHVFGSILFSSCFSYEQRDSHEFLSDLVDFLHDELAASATPQEVIEDNQKSTSSNILQNDSGVLLPTDYFQLNVRVCLECDSCGYSR
jgi:ubiquitin C-terminal hydrolase